MPDERIYQAAANADVEISDDGPHDQGSGEWPDPQAPASGPAPGTTAAAPTTAPGEGEKAGFAAVLDADPVVGGTSAVGDVETVPAAGASSPSGPAGQRAATPDPYNQGDVANPSADAENAGRGKATTH